MTSPEKEINNVAITSSTVSTLRAFTHLILTVPSLCAVDIDKIQMFPVFCILKCNIQVELMLSKLVSEKACRRLSWYLVGLWEMKVHTTMTAAESMTLPQYREQRVNILSSRPNSFKFSGEPAEQPPVTFGAISYMQ